MYTSYTINIGSGSGSNWWCVLYPPLCFTDAATDTISSHINNSDSGDTEAYGSDEYSDNADATVPDSSKEVLKDNISQDDYDYISGDNVTFKFKYLTFLNSLIE